MRFSLFVLLGVLTLSSVANAEWRIKAHIDGFQSPESAFYDDHTGLVFVSEMGKAGDALAKDGSGTVSVLRSDGTLVAKDWIKGLNSPKGVYAHLGRFLLIAEKDSIYVVQYQMQLGGSVTQVSAFRQPIVTTDPTKKPRRAQLLNDITVGNNGEVYVTDTFGNRIFLVTGLFMPQSAQGQAPQGVRIEDFVSGLHLLSPNGIAFFAGRLWVVGTDTFTGLGNFQTPFSVTTDRREFLTIPANPEKPLPALHPLFRPIPQRVPRNSSPEQLIEEIAQTAADPSDSPNIFDPAKPPKFSGDPTARMINVANSFQKPHSGKLYSVDVKTKLITVYPDPTGGFDGVAIAQDSPFTLYVGEFSGGGGPGDFGGRIHSLTIRQAGPSEPRELLEVPVARSCAKQGFCSNPADFSINSREGLLYLPNLSGGEVQIWKFER